MEQTKESIFEEQCEKAARALKGADVLLVVAGAGHSADSGLAVYGDVAKVKAYQKRGMEYPDVSQPAMINRDPELYFGFWGQSFNDYRETKPHEGYAIIASWRKDKCGRATAMEIQDASNKRVELQNPFEDEEVQRSTPFRVENDPAGAFHVFTSNVDAHFYDYFGAHEINSCHGNIELWQCSSRDCPSGIWRAPLEHKFCVDTTTMLAPELVKDIHCVGDFEDTPMSPGAEEPAAIGQVKGTGTRTNILVGMPPGVDKKGWRLDKGTNWPKCGLCGSLARPSIFCFGDFGWKFDKSEELRWEIWKESVLDVCGRQGSTTSVCILEIGCGVNVQTCRSTSEQLLEDVLEKGGKPQLIRINPDSPRAPRGSVAEKHTIPVGSRGLRALQKIDALYKPLCRRVGSFDEG